MQQRLSYIVDKFKVVEKDYINGNFIELIVIADFIFKDISLLS